VSLDLNWRNKHGGMKNMPIFRAESKIQLLHFATEVIVKQVQKEFLG
tara:strand:+ start:338 stop:478 length:141 start_codon:yes stop_codon:yes gene_type:complete